MNCCIKRRNLGRQNLCEAASTEQAKDGLQAN